MEREETLTLKTAEHIERVGGGWTYLSDGSSRERNARADLALRSGALAGRVPLWVLAASAAFAPVGMCLRPRPSSPAALLGCKRPCLCTWPDLGPGYRRPKRVSPPGSLETPLGFVSLERGCAAGGADGAEGPIRRTREGGVNGSR
jgi:hypothetical protein